MRRRLALLFTGLAIAAMPAVVRAEPAGETRCEQRRVMLDFLASRYDEEPVAMGVAEGGSLVEVLTSKAGDTFTIVVTDPAGRSCMVAAGEGWEALAKTTADLHI